MLQNKTKSSLFLFRIVSQILSQVNNNRTYMGSLKILWRLGNDKLAHWLMGDMLRCRRIRYSFFSAENCSPEV